MNSPFRRFVGFGAILLALVLLFNFLIYFLVEIKIEKKQGMAGMAEIIASQRMLGRQITREAVLLVSFPSQPATRDSLNNSLRNALLVLETNNRYLNNEIRLPHLSPPPDDEQFRTITRNLQQHVTAIVQSGKLIRDNNPSLVGILTTSVIENLMYHEHRLQSHLQELMTSNNAII